MSSSNEIIAHLRDVLGTPEQPLGLHEPCFNGQEWAYTKECLDIGWISSAGAYVDRFGEELAKACGVGFAIPTVNGTAALHIALILAGVARGDEVLMPSLTFVATANAVSYCGAIPHFIECEGNNLGIDIAKLSAHLKETCEIKQGQVYNKHSGRKIAAIVPVHIFGHPVDMDALQTLADHYHLPVVADAAEALGSTYKDSPVSALGLLSALSFNGNKIITTGGGGAILTNDPELAARARHLTTTAKKPHAWSFVHDEVGYNYRMPNINAAVGCAQLEQLNGFLSTKRKLATAYEKTFEGSNSFTFMKEPDNARSNYWLNAICIAPDLDRDALLGALNENGYLCRPVWHLMHSLEMYKDCPRMDLSISEGMERRIINLPSSVKLGLSIHD